MFKFVISELGVLKGLVFFYMVIFISLYIVITVLLNISVSINRYTDDLISENTKGLSFDVTFSYKKDTDLSEFADYIAFGDKKLIYGDDTLRNVTISDGVHETQPAAGTATSFIYGLRGVTERRSYKFIRRGSYPDLLVPENNNGKIWISDKLANASGLEQGSTVSLSSEQFKNSHELELAGIFKQNCCDADFLMSFDSCLEILDSEGYSTRTQVTLSAADYNNCSKMLSKIQDMDINVYCDLYDTIQSEVSIVRMVMNVLLCICMVVAISSAFISFSMSQLIILRRNSSIAMYKLLGLSAGRLKLIYLILTEGLVAVSCAAAFLPARRLTYSLADEYCGMFGLKDLKVVPPERTFPLILVLCSLFTLAGFFKVFFAIDRTSELENVRKSR